LLLFFDFLLEIVFFRKFLLLSACFAKASESSDSVVVFDHLLTSLGAGDLSWPWRISRPCQQELNDEDLGASAVGDMVLVDWSPAKLLLYEEVEVTRLLRVKSLIGLEGLKTIGLQNNQHETHQRRRLALRRRGISEWLPSLRFGCSELSLMKEISGCGNAALGKDVGEDDVVECNNDRMQSPVGLQTKTDSSP
jgi:hypothetical protein